MDVNLESYKRELETLILKSQEHFERQLSYINAGAIGVSFAFIEKLIGSLNDASGKILIFLGWFMLIISLLINLISHFKAKKLHSSTITEINDNSYDQEKAAIRNKVLDIYNKCSLALTILAIILIFIFVIINVN